MWLCLRICVKIQDFASKLWNGSSLCQLIRRPLCHLRVWLGLCVCFMPCTSHKFCVLNLLFHQDRDLLSSHSCFTPFIQLYSPESCPAYPLSSTVCQRPALPKSYLFILKLTGLQTSLPHFRVRGLAEVAEKLFWTLHIQFALCASGEIKCRGCDDLRSRKAATQQPLVAAHETQASKQSFNNTLSLRIWHESVKWIMH